MDITVTKTGKNCISVACENDCYLSSFDKGFVCAEQKSKFSLSDSSKRRHAVLCHKEAADLSYLLYFNGMTLRIYRASEMVSVADKTKECVTFVPVSCSPVGTVFHGVI